MALELKAMSEHMGRDDWWSKEGKEEQEEQR